MNESATGSPPSGALSSGPVARMPLHHWHTARGARLLERDGWMVPSAYTSIERETAAARSSVALGDLSAFAKIAFHGPGVSGLAHEFLGRSAALQARGVALFSAHNPALACRLAEDHLLLLATAMKPPALAEQLIERAPAHGVVPNDGTTSYAGLVLIGPQTQELLRHVTHFDCSTAAFPPGSCAETGLAGVQALLVRPPEMALTAVHICVAWDLAEYVWERLLDAGRTLGITPLGVDAWRSLMLAK